LAFPAKEFPVVRRRHCLNDRLIVKSREFLQPLQKSVSPFWLTWHYTPRPITDQDPEHIIYGRAGIRGVDKDCTQIHPFPAFNRPIGSSACHRLIIEVNHRASSGPSSLSAKEGK